MPITLTHPEDPTKTWTSGFRGKRPNWVVAMLNANPNLLPPTPKEKEAFVPPTDPNVTRYWKWNGLNDEDGEGGDIVTPCIVGAKSANEALVELNKTFRIPVMQTEWATCWREISAKDIQLGEGVFQFNKATSVWEQRKKVAQAK